MSTKLQSTKGKQCVRRVGKYKMIYGTRKTLLLILSNRWVVHKNKPIARYSKVAAEPRSFRIEMRLCCNLENVCNSNIVGLSVCPSASL